MVTRRVINLLLLYNILLVNSCYCNQSAENNKSENNVDNFSNKPNEVVVFLGNPGVGKSTLCNTIFQHVVCNSGISLGKGLTTSKQEYIHENRLYIDTPGLDDVAMREQAAKEIEEALKHNNNYKIVFVAMLDQGRIRPADLATINIVCDAIKTDFEYGIVFNQVSKRIIQEMKGTGLNQENLSEYLTILHKKPCIIVILTRDEDLDGARNIYFQSSDENRERLLKFLDDLKAKRIEESDVKKIDVRDFEEKINEMEGMYKRRIAELNKKAKEQAEEAET